MDWSYPEELHECFGLGELSVNLCLDNARNFNLYIGPINQFEHQLEKPVISSPTFVAFNNLRTLAEVIKFIS